VVIVLQPENTGLMLGWPGQHIQDVVAK